MFTLNDNELQSYINEDVPYFDLTTYLQDASAKQARLDVFTREEVVVSCSEEASRIAVLLGCEVLSFLPSKSKATKGEVLLSFQGGYEKVHQAWRVAQVLLEYSCQIATYTAQMKQEMALVNSHCELLTTRKTFPFAKRLCIKSVMVGGAMPHRLGLSETVLFFPQHRTIYNDVEAFYDAIATFKLKAPEKKIVVESKSLEDAKALMHHGADVIQLDKLEIASVEATVAYRNEHFREIKVLVAGGINVGNVKKYAQTGVDGVVSSAMYACGLSDIGTQMKII